MIATASLPYMTPGLSRQDLAAFDLLARPVWIVDTTVLLPWYANGAALRLWQAPSIEALVARAVTTLPVRLRDRLENGLPPLEQSPTSESLTLTQNGRSLIVDCDISTLTIDGGRAGVLIEGALRPPLPEPSSTVSLIQRVAEMAVHRSSLMVTVFDQTEHVVYQNAAAAAAFSGTNGEFETFHHRFSDTSEATHAWKAVEKGRVYRAETPMPTVNGPRWLACEIRQLGEALDETLPVPTTSNGLILMTARDVTEQVLGQQSLRETVERLARSNTELEQFAWITSHDLREPLRTVISYLNLLRRHLKDKLDETGFEFMNFAIDGARRMDALTRDLLEYASVGRTPQPMRDVFLSDVLDRVVLHWEQALKDCGGRVLYGRLPTVFGDEEELFKLFCNLVGNAIKYRRATDPLVVTIVAEEERKAWMLAVIDNGEGIEPRYFDRIFQIFQRLHGQSSDGTGVGLALCRKIVERHGGRIWVESQLGKGAAFFLTLPR